MKVVLLSIIIFITVVQVSPRCTRVFGKNSTKTRRYVPTKEADYSTRLNTDDRFSKQLGVSQLKEDRTAASGLARPRHRKGISLAKGRDSKKFGARSVKTSNRPIAPALNFHSPEQLQEYLFSEAGNAKHILRSNAAFSDSEYVPKKTRTSTSNRPGDYRGKSGGVHQRVNGSDDLWWDRRSPISKDSNFSPERDNHDIVWGKDKYYQFLNKYGEEKMPEFKNSDLLRESQLPPSFPQDISDERMFSSRNNPPPYLYSPEWYEFGEPFFFPRPRLNSPYDRRLYESPSRTTPKKAKKDDRAVGDDVVKLKQMVDELVALSEEVKEVTGSGAKSENDKKDETAEDAEKIEKIIIPILSKISKDLHKNGTTMTTTTSAMMMTTATMTTTTMTTMTTPTPFTTKKAEAGETDGKKDRDAEAKKESKTNTEEQKKETDAKKDYPCKIDGVWTGTSQPLQLNITTSANMTVKVTVVSDSGKKNSDIGKDWTINGLTLGSFGGPFMIAAVCPEKRRVASFIGQCRTCREEDIIFGLWTFTTASKDCAELFTTVETKMDLFRREKGTPSKVEKSLAKDA